VTAALLDRAVWTQCPACKQCDAGEYVGRIVIRGDFAAANEAAIRRRILNVATRAAAANSQRRLVAIERAGDVLEVLTTSQKLAHRIAHELKKAFRGRATYKWSDDGSLFAVWERD
jgi:NMD protein affecting ribosome stability and mRNA decay